MATAPQIWIPVDVSPGMFDNEYGVSIKLKNGKTVSLFADKFLVKEEQNKYFLRVTFIETILQKKQPGFYYTQKPLKPQRGGQIYRRYRMILSNCEIVKCLQNKLISIDPIENLDPSEPPFNTSSIDLRLGDSVLIPKDIDPVQLDLRKGGISGFLAKNSESHQLSSNRPFSLQPNQFILAKTFEKVDFPIHNETTCYSARVEGKSSLARCGILIHFTAPTIHAGFTGTITLEIINLGPISFLLTPGMYICQLIVEEVKGCPADAPNQFKGQISPAGIIE